MSEESTNKTIAPTTPIEERLRNSKQEHLLRFEAELSLEQRAKLIDQLDSIDLDGVNALYERANSSLTASPQLLDQRMRPIPADQFESEERCSDAQLDAYHTAGLQAIADGTVAVLLMAGGQGTRLGTTHPKGMYSIGLPSGKKLFQIQAERIQRLQKIALEKTKTLGRIPWYIMTSKSTHQETEEFLRINEYFGLRSEDVHLFKQGELPCFDFAGKILLKCTDTVAMSPDGNGGIYRALLDSGALENMKERGVRYVHTHSVDNILVKVADPVFVGYFASKGADCGAKVVRKTGPSEAVGVVCQVDGHFQVVEYSEIAKETAEARDSAGELLFNSGNICNHLFTVPFLEKIAEEHESALKLHVAKKRIPFVDDAGHQVQPAEPNGIKIEKFVFDVFEFSENFVTWEVPRSSEFSALKNTNDVGKDCPQTARRDLLALHRSYIEKAGGIFENDCDVEISPLLSYSGENLDVKGRVFKEETVLE